MLASSTGSIAFRSVPRTGVIYVTTEAQKLGFGKPGAPGDREWCNLGQGMPECGPLPGAAARIQSVQLDDLAQEYSPVPGIWELRQAVADFYNRRYRAGRGSRYSAENVAISSGGRVSLARAAAALGPINLGHFLPDYTAYEELLDIFRLFTPIPIALDPASDYLFSLGQLEAEILGRGLGAVLLSNPCNPTGQVIAGERLAGWIDLGRRLDCTLLFDEFYSHYVWNEHGPMVSAAAFVDDVDRDPVVIFDGLTKNWRYSGWRIAWTVGPKSVIEAVSSAGSFLDGGASRPLQAAAVPLLEDSVVDRENAAIQLAFRSKRDLLLARCRELGLKIAPPPEATFYVWADVSGLRPEISTGMSFFQAGLKERIICVPGEFFDVNPGKRRRSQASRFGRHVRLSFGPPERIIEEGCDRLKQMILGAEV